MLDVIVGTIGGSLGVILFLPQLIKTVKTKSARDLSLMTYLLIFINVTFWMFYGLLTHNLIIYFFNSVGAVLSIIMVVLVWCHGKK